MRILVVDDDAPNRKLLKAMVAKLGECETAESGKDAITAFKKAWEEWNPFDLIFLDILMPEMDGSEVLAKFRELEKEKQLPDKLRVKIIMVSGVTEKEMVMACLRDGCDDFLVKPLEMQLLFSKIKNLGLLPEEN